MPARVGKALAALAKLRGKKHGERWSSVWTKTSHSTPGCWVHVVIVKQVCAGREFNRPHNPMFPKPGHGRAGLELVTAVLRTKILHDYGFESIRISCSRGEIPNIQTAPQDN